jgi:hypothetical protein
MSKKVLGMICINDLEESMVKGFVSLSKILSFTCTQIRKNWVLYDYVDEDVGFSKHGAPLWVIRFLVHKSNSINRPLVRINNALFRYEKPPLPGLQVKKTNCYVVITNDKYDMHWNSCEHQQFYSSFRSFLPVSSSKAVSSRKTVSYQRSASRSTPNIAKHAAFSSP